MFHSTNGHVESPDSRLVELVRTGSQPAREELFRRHFDVSLRVASRVLGGGRDDAVDAVQEGFLKALRHFDQFDGRSEFRTWLLRIVQNAALDLGRQRKRRLAIHLDDANSAAEPAVLQDPAIGLHREDLARALAAALAKLSPDIRESFLLFAEVGLSYKEIADSQNVPIGTVMSRIHFARQKLQAWLEPQLMGESQAPARAARNGRKLLPSGAPPCDVPT